MRLAVLDVPDSQIYLLDAPTGKLIKTLNVSNRGGIRDLNSGIVFSPDGRRIACEFRLRFGASIVSVLGTDSGKELLSLPMQAAPNRASNASLAFSADGRRLRHFEMRTIAPSRPGSGLGGARTDLRVTTWDATPRPAPKQP
jgi:hypothetical protein